MNRAQRLAKELKEFEKLSAEAIEEVKLHIERQNIALANYLLGTVRKNRSKAIKEGLARAKQRGVLLGGARPRPSKVNRKHLRELRQAGLSQTKIAEILHCSQALVSRLLRGKKLKAQMRRKK
jgi:predicted XRE-type DNA-binding protein